MPLGLKFTGRLQQLALFSVANLTFVTLYGSYYYGGVSSPFLPWLLTALLRGVFYFRGRPRLVFSVFCLSVAGFFAAYATNVSFFQDITSEPQSGAGLLSGICP